MDAYRILCHVPTSTYITLNSVALRTAYACVGTSPALSASVSERGPVATVMSALPTRIKTDIKVAILGDGDAYYWLPFLRDCSNFLNIDSLLSLVEIRSGIQPVRA